MHRAFHPFSSDIPVLPNELNGADAAAHLHGVGAFAIGIHSRYNVAIGQPVRKTRMNIRAGNIADHMIRSVFVRDNERRGPVKVVCCCTGDRGPGYTILAAAGGNGEERGWQRIPGGEDRLIGVLPERRKEKERITHKSIMNWAKLLVPEQIFNDKVYFVRVENR